jgi:uridine phosphorylase
MPKQPHLLVEPGDINSTVLLPGDPDRVDRITAQCDDARLLAENREYKVVNAEYNDIAFTVCSTGIGAPSAAIAVEELQKSGAETVVRVGTCGALQEGIEIGDMILATAAAKDEGTTKRYESATIPAVATPAAFNALDATAQNHDETVHTGPIVTDDAFYAETPEYVEDWESAGLLAVEMEAAIIFTLARRHHMNAGAICTVDGNLIEGTQKGTTDDQELPEKARNNVERMITIALEALPYHTVHS